MATQTTNFGMIKDAGSDYYNIDTVNGNFDIIDKGLIPYIGVTSGTVNTYTITAPDIKTLSAGIALSIKFNTDSTGASTLNINSWGAKPIKKANGSNATNLKAAGIYTLRYDGTNFILQGEGASGNAAASDLLLGKTATTDAGEITGEMVNKAGAVTTAPTAASTGSSSGYIEVTVPAAAYYDQTSKLRIYDADFVSSNVPSDINVFGLQGSMKVYTKDGNGIINNGLPNRANVFDGGIDLYLGGAVKGVIPNESYIRRAINNLTPSNLKKGVAVGDGVGTSIVGTLDTNVFTFPITISTSQPAAAANGHIWVNSSQGTSFTAIKILEAVNAGEANGTLMLVTGDLAYRNISVNDTMTLTDGSQKSCTMQDNTGGNWVVSSKANLTMSLNRPMVYSKLGGVLDIETAHMWNGSAWVQLSEKGSYMIHGGSNGFSVYNKNGDTLTKGQELTATGQMTNISKDGKFILTSSRNIYRRMGDVYSLNTTLPGTLAYTYSGSQTATNRAQVLSGDGSTVFALYNFQYSSELYYFIAVYKYNGSTFALDHTTAAHNSNTLNQGVWQLECSSDANVVIAGFASNWNTRIVPWFKNGTTYTVGTTIGGISLYNYKISYDNAFLLIFDMVENTRYCKKYAINYVGRTLTSSGSITISYESRYLLAVHPDGYVFYTVTEGYEPYYRWIYAIRISDMSIFSRSPSSNFYQDIILCFNLAGNRCLYSEKDWSSYTYDSITFNTTAKTFTMTHISSAQTTFSSAASALIPY